MKTKPQRLCVACRTLMDKQNLVRVVSYEGKISIDETGKSNGRGAYICKNKECITKAMKNNIFSKAFKCFVEKSVYDILLDEYGQD